MAKNHNTVEISWVSPKLRLGRVGRGVGIFARRPIRKGERVVVFGGFVVEISRLKALRRHNKATAELIARIGYQVSDDLAYSPVHKNQFSIAEYLNHSCEPNCGFKGELQLVAMRDIKNGEPINTDYAMAVTSPLLLFKSPCLCGTISCRGFVTANDWKKKTLQKRYRGYFQPYIQQKISNLKTSR